MPSSLVKPFRAVAFAAVLAAGAFAPGSTPGEAMAQETRCYLMACTGTTCVAKQVDCETLKPIEPETRPAPAPTQPTT